MQLPVLSSLLFLVTQLFSSAAAAVASSNPQIREPNITAGADFVPAPLGPKPHVINGVPARLSVRVANQEKGNIIIKSIGGSLVNPKTGVIVQNLTALKLGIELVTQQRFDRPYQFTTDLAEQDLQLQITVVLTTSQNELFSVRAYDGLVSIAEPDASIFDPQMLFLYLLLAAGFAGTAYFVYDTWIVSVSPKPRRKFDTPKAPAVLSPPASTASGAKYEESWIPEHHLKRPGNKTRSSSSKAKGRKESDCE